MTAYYSQERTGHNVCRSPFVPHYNYMTRAIYSERYCWGCGAFPAAMKIASLCFQFIFFNFVFHNFFFLVTFRRTALTSHPSSSSMCVFDVYRLTNCMRDILASTSNTPNSVERWCFLLSLSSATHLRSSNIEICLYLFIIILRSKEPSKFCGCRRLAAVRHVRNVISQRNRCIMIKPRNIFVLDERKMRSIWDCRWQRQLELSLAHTPKHTYTSRWTYNWIFVDWRRAPFTFICKTVFDTVPTWVRVFPLVSVGLWGFFHWLCRAARELPLGEMEIRPGGGYVTRVMPFFSVSRFDHINSTSARLYTGTAQRHYRHAEIALAEWSWRSSSSGTTNINTTTFQHNDNDLVIGCMGCARLHYVVNARAHYSNLVRLYYYNI